MQEVEEQVDDVDVEVERREHELSRVDGVLVLAAEHQLKVKMAFRTEILPRQFLIVDPCASKMLIRKVFTIQALY